MLHTIVGATSMPTTKMTDAQHHADDCRKEQWNQVETPFHPKHTAQEQTKQTNKPKCNKPPHKSAMEAAETPTL